MTTPGTLVLVGHADRQPGRPLAPSGRGAGRRRPHLLRGHPAHRPAAQARRRRAPARCSPSTTTPRRGRSATSCAAWRAGSGWPWSPTPACPASPIPASASCGRPPPMVTGWRSCPGRRPRSPALVASGLPAGRFVVRGVPAPEGLRAHRAAGRAGRRAADRGPVRGAAPAGPHARRPARRSAVATAGWCSPASSPSCTRSCGGERSARRSSGWPRSNRVAST